jgi:uncharacterized protein
MKQLTKATRLELKTLSDTGEFCGYGSVFNVEDQGQDIALRGCYAQTITERGARGIKMLHEHDPSRPIGYWTSLVEDEFGLLCTGKLMIDALEKAREVYALMKAGVLDGLSIGYRVVKSRSDRASQARILEVLDLKEISLVMFPMNEQSLVTSVKGAMPTEREFERWLMQDAGFTRSQAREVISRGYKSITAKPGAGDDEDQADQFRGLSRDLDRLGNLFTS